MNDAAWTEEARDLRQQLHALEIEQKGEIVRRQGETSAIRDALVDIKSAIKAFTADSKDIKSMFADAKAITARLEARVDEMRVDLAEWKTSIRAQIDGLHSRISNVGREAREGTQASEDRMQSFLYRWLPLIVGGVVGGLGLVVGARGVL